MNFKFKSKEKGKTQEAPAEAPAPGGSAAAEDDINLREWEANVDPMIASIDKDDLCIDIRNINLWYGEKQALYDVDLPVKKNAITALIGPSGCGKSTLIRSINRMNDLVEGCRVEGTMEFDGGDLYAPDADINSLRTRIGMIFQKPNPFPMTIRENITYGPRLHGVKDKKELNEIVDRCLQQAALYDEVADRLDKSALGLSGGQQQRLCIARSLSVNPEVLLMDEPTSALDPIATSRIEDLATELKRDYTVVIVTHNMQQASRISDYTGFMYLGKMIEFNETGSMFNKPEKPMTERYLTGRFGRCRGSRRTWSPSWPTRAPWRTWPRT